MADAKRSQQEAYWCKLVGKSGKAETAGVAAESFAIGRAPGNDMQVPDQRISSVHCILRRVAKSTVEYLLEDRSTNGTFVNGERVGKGHSRALKNADVIALLSPGQVSDAGPTRE